MTAPKPQLEGKVLVAGAWWEIVVDPDLPSESDNDGETIFRQHRIRIADSRTGLTIRTVIHELLHATERTVESDIPHDTIAIMAAGVATALLSRPDLARWIADRAEEGG